MDAALGTKNEESSSNQDLEHQGMSDKEEARQREAAFGARETKVISYIRFVVFLVLAGVATAVSISVYRFTGESEDERFESAFVDHSSKLIDAFRTNAARRIAAIDSLSMAFTSHAISLSAEWPFVTLPDYERRASRVMDLAEVIAIFQFPLIANETRKEWESYALEHQGWLAEGIQQRQEEIIQRTQNGDSALENEKADLEFLNSFLQDTSNYGIPPEIYQPIGTETGPEDGPGPYFPVWQFSPALPLYSLVNFNAIKGPSHTKELEAVLESERVVTSQALDFSDETDPNVFGRKPLLNLILNRWKGGGNAYEDGPVSDFYYPVYDSFDPSSRKLVAVFDALVYWQVYFVNVLPVNADGVIVVLENTCNQTFTYAVDGPKAHYLGQGDLHDPEFDEYGVSTGFGAFLGMGADEYIVEKHHCSYNVKVYPSTTYKDSYATKTPLLFTIILACCFLFTSLVFVVYDCLVEKRQNKVLETAVKSTEVVENLFPAEVREGLYKSNPAISKPGGDEADEMLQHLQDGSKGKGDSDAYSPNAHNYPHCTVFFADLAGFTKWSDNKSPAEVFKLLEELYGSFDAIATKRNVFKVETIGDCYLAITGLPKPQKDHAVRMAEFANDCLLKMNQLRSRLIVKLGIEAGELALRVGLHSGAVTGGVLRGSKARFQLFGDTVNTAARMESTGKPGMIQASKETMELLVSAGKGDWIRAREEKIEAKGKGQLQTFWIEVKGEGSAIITSTCSSVSAEVSPKPDLSHGSRNSDGVPSVKAGRDILRNKIDSM